jgi:hypothetical protein
MVVKPLSEGSVKHPPVGRLAASAYLMLLGALLETPFLLSAYAQQNDVFMTNLFLAPPIYAIGSTLFIVSLIGLGLNRWMALALALLNPLAVVLLLWLFGLFGMDGIPALAVALVVASGILIVLSLVAATSGGHRGAWAKAMALAVSGAGLFVLANELFGSRYLAFGETVSSLPQYLSLPMLVLGLGLSIVILLVGWAWGKA